MSEVLQNADVQSKFVEDGDPEPKIQLCDAHDLEMREELAENQAFTEKAYLKAFHALCTLAAQTIGTDGLTEFKCPVCAFQQFPFIKRMAEAAHASANRPRIVVPQ